MQASWRGEAVRAVRDGLTLAPYSKSSLAHSRLPEAQALHRGVLPWMVRTSTWKNRRNNSHFLTQTHACYLFCITLHHCMPVFMIRCRNVFDNCTSPYLHKSGLALHRWGVVGPWRFIQPGLQPPAAAGHSSDEPVCRLHGAE